MGRTYKTLNKRGTEDDGNVEHREDVQIKHPQDLVDPCLLFSMNYPQPRVRSRLANKRLELGYSPAGRPPIVSLTLA